ncbi:MAG: hypothetical protein GX777_08655, partial [Fastidiosipila sp.]|nr:hypothetical protein [Fastidiosipila sp.]
GNVNQDNKATLTWKGGSQSADKTVTKRIPGILKTHAFRLNEDGTVALNDQGNKFIDWSIDFNTAEHVLTEVVLTDTYTPANRSASDFKLFKYDETQNVFKEVTYLWQIGVGGTYEIFNFNESLSLNDYITKNDGSFTINLGKLEGVKYKLTYTTTLSAEEEKSKDNEGNSAIKNTAAITYTGLTNENNESVVVVDNPVLSVDKASTGLYKKLNSDDNPLISWEITVNNNPLSGRVNLKDPVLTDTIPGDQKLVENSIKVYRTDDLTKDLIDSGELVVRLWDSDIPANNKENVGDYSFLIELPDGPYSYIVEFDTEIIKYPSHDPSQHDKYNNSTTLYNAPVIDDSGETTYDLDTATAYRKYFTSNDPNNLTAKTGEQDLGDEDAEGTENIDWTVTLNPDALTIYNPIIVDKLDVNQNGVNQTLQQDYVTDAEGKVIRILGPDGVNELTNYYIEWIYDDSPNNTIIRGFKIIFTANGGEIPVLSEKITLSYSTRLKPNIVGTRNVTNRIELFGANKETALDTKHYSTQAEQWFYGGGGSGTQVAFNIIKQNQAEDPLSGIKFDLYYMRRNAIEPEKQVEEITTDVNGKVTVEGIRSGRYFLEEVIDNVDPLFEPVKIYFLITYAAGSTTEYVVTITNHEWNLDEDFSHDNAEVIVDESAEDSNINTILVTNDYVPATLGLKVTKALENNELENVDRFSFHLSKLTDENPDVWTVIDTEENDDDGEVVFDDLEFDAVGEYIYTITEFDDGREFIIFDETVYKVVVTVGYLIVDTPESGLEIKNVEYNRIIQDEDGEEISTSIQPDDLIYNNTYAPVPTKFTVDA